MRRKIENDPRSEAISIAHLHAIRQTIGSSNKWACILEEDAAPTTHFATGIIAALLALSGSPLQSNSVHEDPPAVIYLLQLMIIWFVIFTSSEATHTELLKKVEQLKIIFT